jgi:hypothetical protein
MNCKQSSEPVCPLPEPTDISELDLILLDPDPPMADYQEASALARQQADQELGENRLLSWYDQDRDFASPLQTSESLQEIAMPSYVEYGIRHGATLQIDIHGGRFVFFFLPLGES